MPKSQKYLKRTRKENRAGASSKRHKTKGEDFLTREANAAAHRLCARFKNPDFITDGETIVDALLTMMKGRPADKLIDMGIYYAVELTKKEGNLPAVLSALSPCFGNLLKRLKDPFHIHRALSSVASLYKDNTCKLFPISLLNCLLKRVLLDQKSDAEVIATVLEAVSKLTKNCQLDAELPFDIYVRLIEKLLVARRHATHHMGRAAKAVSELVDNRVLDKLLPALIFNKLMEKLSNARHVDTKAIYEVFQCVRELASSHSLHGSVSADSCNKLMEKLSDAPHVDIKAIYEVFQCVSELANNSVLDDVLPADTFTELFKDISKIPHFGSGTIIETAFDCLSTLISKGRLDGVVAGAIGQAFKCIGTLIEGQQLCQLSLSTCSKLLKNLLNSDQFDTKSISWAFFSLAGLIDQGNSQEKVPAEIFNNIFTKLLAMPTPLNKHDLHVIQQVFYCVTRAIDRNKLSGSPSTDEYRKMAKKVLNFGCSRLKITAQEFLRVLNSKFSENPNESSYPQNGGVQFWKANAQESPVYIPMIDLTRSP